VGVSPTATVVQDVPRLNGTVRSNGRGASAVRSAWDPTDKYQGSDDEGLGRKPGSSAKPRSHEIIDVHADEEESRYGIPTKKRRKTTESQVIDAETVYTTDEGSEDGEVIVVAETKEEYPEEKERRAAERSRGRVKIDRKRAFWASKGGAVAVVSPLPLDGNGN
jgi:hypothetical protein